MYNLKENLQFKKNSHHIDRQQCFEIGSLYETINHLNLHNYVVIRHEITFDWY